MEKQQVRANRLMKFLGVAATILAFESTHATTLVQLSTEDLTVLADRIVVGRVLRDSASSNGRMIYTKTTVEVTDTWKGSAEEQITIHSLGGTVGTLRARVNGSPVFLAEEEVILFLEEDRQGRLRVLGMEQGKRSILRSPEGSTLVVRAALPLEWSGEKPSLKEFQTRVLNQSPMSDFRSRVRAVLQEAPLQPRELPAYQGVGR